MRRISELEQYARPVGVTLLGSDRVGGAIGCEVGNVVVRVHGATSGSILAVRVCKAGNVQAKRWGYGLNKRRGGWGRVRRAVVMLQVCNGAQRKLGSDHL